MRSIPASAGEPGLARQAGTVDEVYPRECGGTLTTAGPAAPWKGLSPRVRGNRGVVRRSAARRGSIPASAGEPRRGSSRRPAGRVYPRECGGTRQLASVVDVRPGLSPRVRGNHALDRLLDVAYRSIPASAGEPRRWRPCGPIWRVYPRECGGTVPAGLFSSAPRGLSPRVRGNRARGARRRPFGRSIPASAGEPGADTGSRRKDRVYPRECGGTLRTLPSGSSWPGLSPRVRGNQAVAQVIRRHQGSIPASAGEPNSSSVAIVVAGVYPRECGGTGQPPRGRLPRRGLSPRVRGNPAWQFRAASSRGSIPASAGEPSSAGRSGGKCKVYPRECGGTHDVRGHRESGAGLSPRVRGNPLASRPVRTASRSIPASAGEPWPWSPSAVARRVYPRECGGTAWSLEAASAALGLSPRVRGNPGNRSGIRTGARSIPASAGEPGPGRGSRLSKGVYPRECGGTAVGRSWTSSSTGLSPRVRGNP